MRYHYSSKRVIHITGVDSGCRKRGWVGWGEGGVVCLDYVNSVDLYALYAKNGKIAGPKLFAPPPQDAPLLKGRNF